MYKFVWLAILFFLLSLVTLGQTDGWKQYSSATPGYKAKYPADWEAAEKWVWPVSHLTLISPRVEDNDVSYSASIQICSQPKGFVPKSSNSDTYCHLRDSHLSELYKNKVVSDQTVEINGIKVRKTISENKYRPEATFLDAFFSTSDRDILISGNFPRRFNLEQYIPIFDKLLATLQIVYKDAELAFSDTGYGFSIEYSASWKSCPVNNRNYKKNDVLLLVPEGGLCNGANSILISTFTEKSSPAAFANVDLLLKQQNLDGVTGGLFGANVLSVSGQRIENDFLYRQSFLRSRQDGSRATLRISEMYDVKKVEYQKEGERILTSLKLLN